LFIKILHGLPGVQNFLEGGSSVSAAWSEPIEPSTLVKSYKFGDGNVAITSRARCVRCAPWHPLHTKKHAKRNPSQPDGR